MHLDTLDLYVARQRHTFIKQAAAELYVEEAVIKRDLGRVLLELEAQQEALIREKLGPRTVDVPVMTDQQRQEALELLQDPQLIARIQSDFDACGLVGEETNRLVCYLACVSRLMARPLAVLIQSSSGAGKTTLQDATLRFMPAEQQVRLSAMTGQSLYYMGRTALQHKILAVAEEQGVAEAAYALKLLQSEGRLSIATAEQERRQRPPTDAPVHPGRSGRHAADHHGRGPGSGTGQPMSCSENERTAGADRGDQPLPACRLPAARGSVERPRQRHAAAERAAAVDAIRRRHPVGRAADVSHRSDSRRRDNAKYLALIASITLLHQYQRQQVTRSIDGTQQACVIATLDDLEVANRLAGATLGTCRQVLLPQTRQLLEQLVGYVTRCAAAQPCCARHGALHAA